MVTFAEKELEDHGVDLYLNDGVKAFEDKENSVSVTLNSGLCLEADIIILAIGVTPDTFFLKDSGIKLGARGHIIVSENMQTSIDSIYAVGDAVEITDYVNGQKTMIPLAGPANKQGRIAADNIAGIISTYKGTQGTSVIKIFELTGAGTGNNERTLQRYNIPYKVIYVHPQSHASYYPGATPISLKLIFNMEGKILGAQAFGYEGVEKRIDDIATVIRLKGTITDLTELELSYAPPYSSAKDPVNMAGYVAENVITGRADVILPKDLENFDKDKIVLIDVRTDLEFNNGHIPGALNIAVDDLRENLEKFDKNKELWIYCQVGLRGYIASRILSQKGYKVKNLTGGYKTYVMANYTSNKKDKASNEGDASKQVVLDTDTQLVKEVGKTNKEISFDRALDACGLCCPGPLMQVKMCMDDLKKDTVLKVTASDAGFYTDIQSWCKSTKNQLIDLSKNKGIITAYIKKCHEGNSSETAITTTVKDNKTMVVFSGDLDKAIASFIIANGAASMGKKVTMFFTFWGLNILRKHEKVNTQKGFLDKMFGMMMPRGSRRLKLSNMNMMGMGGKMIRKVMKDKNVSSLEDLIKAAMDNGVEIVACQMSLDVMGLKKEELIDGVEIGGVGYYLGEAEEANVNLFI
jgi:peroxiredoxin family protein/rhodanese-related sulfurtransferase/TusA-related sulfurtransferase